MTSLKQQKEKGQRRGGIPGKKNILVFNVFIMQNPVIFIMAPVFLSFVFFFRLFLLVGG